MSYRFKDARVQSGISQKDAAEQLQVSAATVNNWESGRRLPTIDALEKMADLYGVSTDYLLGRTDSSNPFRRIAESIDKDILPFLHDHPVFINNNRWGLVDAINERIRFLDGSELPFSDATQISEIGTYIRVWVEPISKDEALRQEMRGWYTVKNRFVENELGQRFYLDTYGNKWLAFME